MRNFITFLSGGVVLPFILYFFDKFIIKSSIGSKLTNLEAIGAYSLMVVLFGLGGLALFLMILLISQILLSVKIN